MYLKTVDLFGFKTFAERTCFVFEPGISGIVGPNGSGKSNLVDAVRWVLGEQSAKQLRGERMDAVIFAGNHRRRPLGMSEVTLTFDNSDGALATPFAEVSVTRRVYRNGEGEYFLNKTQVRLKDIMDLLLGTGLGPDAAAIISQGQIDAILSAKPEARREVFEEVAGTSRYQARKREALRRLEHTDQNALRINDVLVELERQVPAVERQVRRAKRYRKLQQRLRDLEILTYVRKTSERRSERDVIAADLKARDRSSIGSQRAQLEAEMGRVRYEEYQATLALDDSNSSRNQSAAAVQEAATLQAAAQARLEEGGRLCESAERDVDAAAKAISDAEASLSRLRADLAGAREKRDKGLRAVEAAAEAERDAATAWEQGYAALRAIEDRRARAAAKAAEGGSASQAAQSERDRTAQTLAHLDEAIAAARARAAHDRRRRESIESEIAALAKEIERCSKAFTEAEHQRARAEAEVERARVDLDRRRNAVVETGARIDALREVENSDLSTPTGVAAVKTAATAGKLKGVVGVFADVITVDPTHAAAIDAALGVHAHDVIVRTTTDVRAAISYLSAQRAGRATFLSLESVKKTVPSPLSLSDPGIVGFALDLVRVAPEARAAAEYLLANVAVVDTLDTGTRLGTASPSAIFATLDGAVVRGAAISGGESETGPLARRTTLQTLTLAQTTSESVAHAAQSDFENARAQFAAASSEVERLGNARVDAQLRRKDAETTLAGVRAEIAVNAQQSSALEEQHRQARQALDAASAHAKEFNERASLSKHDIDALESERAAAAAQSDKLHAALGAVRDRHRAIAAETAAQVERVAQMSDDVEGAQTNVASSRTSHGEKQTALANARADREKCAAELARLSQTRAQADRELAKIQADSEGLRVKREELSARVRALDEQVAGAQTQEREQSLELERRKIRLAEIDAELSVLGETFAQNPASQPELDDVSARYAAFAGDIDSEIREVRHELDRMGDVNLSALEDQAALVERRDFLRQQLGDLEQARRSILAVIADIDAESVRLFNTTFERVSAAFSETFARLFGGGVGKIWLAESEDPMSAGVEIAAQPPGKKMQSLHALSGGERALTAVALIFAILQVRPSPFYIFDEIDAALDEANIGRFGILLAELANRAQIIIITHNKATMTLADRIYGVTMGEPGVSSVLSLALEQVGA